MTPLPTSLVRLWPVTALALASCAEVDGGSALEESGWGWSAAAKADGDGDGYDEAVDCDDANAAVNPGASESDNLTDDDCDDYVDEDFVSVGDIIVTEINKRSQIGTGGIVNDASWVEVYNTSSRTVSLANWVIARGITSGNQVYIDPASAPVLAAGEYAVFCDTDNYEGSAAAYPLSCDYMWGDETQAATYVGTYHDNTWYMRRDKDRFALYINGNRTTGTLIDGVSYYYDAVNGYWPNNSRFSLSLDSAYYTSGLNDNRLAWCSTSSSAAGTVSGNSIWRWYDTPGVTTDEYGTPGATNYDCLNDPDLDSDGYTGATDCDEADATVNPGASETCDGIDNDCNGVVDDGSGYADADSDGYGDPATPVTCGSSGGVSNDDDCDDANGSINPAATEADDGSDGDCDGWVDEDFVATGDIVISEVNKRSIMGGGSVVNNASWLEVVNVSTRTVDLSNWVLERGSGSTANSIMIDPAEAVTVAAGGMLVFCDSNDYEGASTAYPLACDYYWGDESQPASYVGDYHDNTFYLRRDADDVSLSIEGDSSTGRVIDDISYNASYPNYVRFSLSLDPVHYDSSDNDSASNWCLTSSNGAGTPSNNTSYRWYDVSGTPNDEHGTPGESNYDCVGDEDGDGYSNPADCDDTDATINPAATEVCDGVDNDCDGSTDEGTSGSTTWYADGDGDDYGDPSGSTSTACTMPSGYSTTNDDCDDTSASINPGATEVCNDGIDQDCDATTAACLFSGTEEIKADYDFRAYGTGAEYAVGSSVANNGDFDGDGFDDVAVGQLYHDTSPATDNGRVHLWLGPVDTSDSLSTAHQTFDGSTTRNSDYLGSALRFVPDYDGDLDDELLVAANRADTSDYGAAYLFEGNSSATSVSGADATFTTTTASAYVGSSVYGGDVDNDGMGDVAVGAYGYSSSAGAAGVWFAGDIASSNSLSAASVLITGASAGHNLGYSIALCDIDADGTADGIFGAPAASATTVPGKTYIFYGMDAMSGSAAASTADAILAGSSNGDRQGLAVACLGDVSGDGTADIVTTSDKNDGAATDAGAAYVITSWPSGSSNASAAADTIIRGSTASDYFGRTAAGAGDTNGDTYADLLVGATGYDVGALSGAGAVYFWYGPLSSGTVSASSFDALFTGANSNDAVGYTIDGGGDVDADGNSDWMSGATSWDGFGYSNSGGSWLFYGRSE
ncbi:MAG: lamin tail domain-containing protein [Deltaproteobacteria bacterium]|nr:lamin tail domain-containing protein [Deltaproteobacteria bacterium]